MAIEGPGRAGVPSLTSLPRYEDIPRIGDGLDADRVREAFDAFRRHAAQLQAQLRVLQVAGAGAAAPAAPTGHAVRMDALHLIRAAAEFADTIERDAQNASASQLGKTEQEISRRQRSLQDDTAEVDRYRQESERQRAEMLNAARNEARELLAKAHADSIRELQEAEAKGDRLLEQARHQATELTNAARAEVEQTLEWARTQATTVLARAQHGAEQLLSAAGLGQDAIAQVAGAIMRAAEQAADGASRPPAAAFSGPSAAPEPEPEPEPPTEVPAPPEASSTSEGASSTPPSTPSPSAGAGEESAGADEEPSEPQP